MDDPAIRTAVHLATCLDGRVQLPPGVGLEVLRVGAVAHGWVEMTDDPDAPVLTMRPAVVGTRRRVRLPRGGVAERFGRDHRTLLCLALRDPARGATCVLGCSMEHLWRLAAHAGPAPLTLRAAGWSFPWAAVDLDAGGPREVLALSGGAP